MAKRITKAEQIAKKSPEEFGRLSGKSGMKQLLSYARTLKSGYTRRVSSFNRKGLVSYAKISFENSYPKDAKQVPLTKMTRNQLLLEIARYSKFFNDQTSSEAGIRRINREQDKRIFGTDSRGHPLRTMTAKEREDYWDFYDEFRNQNPEWSTQPFSESVQHLLGDMFRLNLKGKLESGEEKYFNQMSFTEKLEFAKQRFIKSRREEIIEDTPNVYLGRRSNNED